MPELIWKLQQESYPFLLQFLFIYLFQSVGNQVGGIATRKIIVGFYCEERKKGLTLPKNRFRVQVLVCGLKGNRVEIPDSPAAVMLRYFLKKTLTTGRFFSCREGFRKGASQKTCRSMTVMFLLVGLGERVQIFF